MRQALFPAAVLLMLLCVQDAIAQNTSPYWSLSGNSNVSSSSKLGTTNGIPLRLYTKNVERLRIDTAGKVGIGITSPPARLSINTPAGTAPLVVQIGGSSKLFMHANAGLAVGGSSTPPATGLYVAGNVGIGTNAPENKLHVFKGSAGTVTAYPLAGLIVESSTAGYINLLAPDNTETGIFFGKPQSNISGGIVYSNASTPNGLQFRTGGNNIGMVLTSAGNVGIGTLTPVTTLEVKRTDGSYLIAKYTNSATVGNRTALIDIQNGDNVVWRYGVGGTGNGLGLTLGQFYLERYGQGPVLVINQQGNMSLGSNPDAEYRLFVKGRSGIYGEANDGTAVTGNGIGSNYGIAGISQYGYAGYFAGNVYTTGSYLPSARKLKQNITAMSDALALISKLQPKEYEYKQDGNYKLMHLPEGKRYGLIAEEVEEVLPGLVNATEFDPQMAEPREGGANKPTQVSEKIQFKALNYIELIPIMIKGMQEQQQENEALKARIEKLEELVSRLTTGQAGTVVTGMSSLEQNAPNPVSGTTAIRYHIAETATAARLDIANTKGQVVKTISLGNKGIGQVSLNTTMLAAGTYNYTLYVDGKQVDSKRLVVAR